MGDFYDLEGSYWSEDTLYDTLARSIQSSRISLLLQLPEVITPLLLHHFTPQITPPPPITPPPTPSCIELPPPKPPPPKKKKWGESFERNYLKFSPITLLIFYFFGIKIWHGNVSISSMIFSFPFCNAYHNRKNFSRAMKDDWGYAPHISDVFWNSFWENSICLYPISPHLRVRSAEKQP